MKQFFKGMVDKPHLAKRLILCFLSCVIMGFCVSWLKFIHLGTDPCSLMNFVISDKIGWEFGNYCAVFNCVLFLFVLLFGRNQIGFGTVMNMFLVGYACDFMTWIRANYIIDTRLDSMTGRGAIMIVTLAMFVFVVAIYMSVELGTAPFDAIPLIVSKRMKKVPFKWIRIAWDMTATLIGIAVGGIFEGEFGIVTVIMALAIGPVASLVKKKMQKYIA